MHDVIFKKEKEVNLFVSEKADIFLMISRFEGKVYDMIYLKNQLESESYHISSLFINSDIGRVFESFFWSINILNICFDTSIDQLKILFVVF
jgi:hypothetical protein